MRKCHFVCAVFIALLVCWSLSLAETAKEFQDKGEAAYKSKDYAKAVDYYTEALKLEPNRHETIYARGVNYYKLKKYDDALADFNKVKDVKKIDHHALYYIGLIYNEKKELSAAFNAFADAAKLEPQNVLYDLNAARTAVQMDSRPSALVYYKQALKLDPSNKEADRYIKARRAAIARMEKTEAGRLVAAQQPTVQSDAGPTIECIELKKLVESKPREEFFSHTLPIYGELKYGEMREPHCTNVDGKFYCFRCFDTDGNKVVNVQEDPRGGLHLKGYGCPCSKK